MKQTLEQAVKEAIHKHYNCNGKYPCTEREYCQYCGGHNSAYDCGECGADEFNEGFRVGAEWRINDVWHDARTENPEPCELVLVETFDMNIDLFMTYDGKSDKSRWERWAYVTDLLPEGGAR